jgi:predicted nuclease of predicted toxin-antitoxin system
VKVLVDNNLPVTLGERLRPRFPGSIHLRELHYQRAPDEFIWKYAAEHGFTLLTKDYDFCRYSDLYGHPPKVVWVGIGNQRRNKTVEIVLRQQKLIHDFIGAPLASLLILK